MATCNDGERETETEREGEGGRRRRVSRAPAGGLKKTVLWLPAMTEREREGEGGGGGEFLGYLLED